MMNPRRTAIQDQAQAAEHHAQENFHQLAQLEDTEVIQRHPGPVIRAILDRLRTTMVDREAAGEPTTCPHLSYDAPSSAIWLAFVPDKLRCPPCASEVAGSNLDVLKARPCDHCQTGKIVQPGAAQLKPVIVQVQNHIKAIPPVTAIYGLCETCYDQEWQ